MPNIGENTMQELENILNDSETDADRLGAFLKLKTNQRQPTSNPKFLLDPCDISFDLDVDLVKQRITRAQSPRTLRSPRASQLTRASISKNVSAQAALNGRGVLQDTLNSFTPAKDSDIVAASHNVPEKPEEPQDENLPRERAQNVSPTLRLASPFATMSPPKSRCSGIVSHSDHLRRVAIKRRSKSLGRRDLQLEFNNVSNVTARTSSSFNFLPAVSSTPAPEKPKEKEAESQAPTQKSQQVSTAAAETETGEAREVDTRTANGTRTGQESVQNDMQYEQFETSYLASLMNLKSRGNMPFTLNTSNCSRGRPSTPLSGGNFTEENRKELTPSEKSNTSPEHEKVEKTLHKSLRVRVKRAAELYHAAALTAHEQDVTIIVSNTPPSAIPETEPDPEPESEHIVPETQVQEVPQVQELPQEQEQLQEDAPLTRQSPNPNEMSSSEEQELSSAPLNLAPVLADNTTKHRRMRRRKAQHEPEEKSMQLLDLHNSRGKKKRSLRGTKKIAKAVLNKPSRAPINGEQFAKELARMNNYEIMDLRKRKSIGLLEPVDGQRDITEDQLVIEQSIQWEILRRNLTNKQQDGSCNGLTPSRLMVYPQERGERSISTSPEPAPAEPPNNFKDSPAQDALSGGRQKTPSLFTTSMIPPPKIRSNVLRRSRTRCRDPPVSKELQNYIRASETLRMRMRSGNNNCSKRSLYTKGNSDTEGDSSKTPPRQRSLNIEIIPAPPTSTESSDDIFIVPPPPASVRYSHNLRTLQWVEQLPHLSTAPDEELQPDTCSEEEEPVTLPAPPPPPPAEFNNNATMMMEELRMETPTPPPLSIQKSPPRHVDSSILDEQPSTSRAAREALELSIRQESHRNEQEPQIRGKTKQLKKNSKNNTEADQFKIPLAPAPRSKRTRKATAKNSMQEAQNETELGLDTTGNRRSKRGHVPLQNTFCHTLADPFAFMRRAYEGKPKRKPAGDRSNSQLINSSPLCSSTPLNPPHPDSTESGSSGTTRKRKRHQEPTHQQEYSEITGIMPLSDITEEVDHEPEPIVQPSEDKSPTKRRGRKRKKSPVEPEIEAELESEPATEELELVAAPVLEPEPQQPDSTPEPQPACGTEKLELAEAPVLKPEPEEPLLQFIHWLRGNSDVAPEPDDQSDVEYESMNAMSASQLNFSKLDGIDYAFFMTEENYALGYMRFQPRQERGMKRNKLNILRFIALYGQFKFESIASEATEMEQLTLNIGGMVEIKEGSRFNITNLSNEVGLLIVNRK